MTTDQQREGRGITRRTVTRGMAWTVPAVSIAAAAPAYAVTGPTPDIAFVGACKFPGNSCQLANKGYGMAFAVENNDTEQSIFFCDPVITDSTAVDNQGSLIDLTYTGGCIEVGPGESETILFYFEGSADSQNQTFTFDLTVDWGHTCPCSNDPDHEPFFFNDLVVSETPPGGDICACDGQ